MAPIKFKTALKKNPITKAVAYHAASVTPEVVTLKDIISEIEQTSTVSEADIVAVIKSFQREVVKNLKAGRSVHLDDLGRFRTSISGTACATAEAVNAGTIRRLRTVWSPSPRILKSVRVGAEGVTFEKVQEKKEDAEGNA